MKQISMDQGRSFIKMLKREILALCFSALHLGYSGVDGHSSHIYIAARNSPPIDSSLSNLLFMNSSCT